MTSQKETEAMAEATKLRFSKEALAKAKADFALHVMLIMKQNSVPKSKANFIAWLEGEDGFNIRLGTPKLPLEEPKK